MDTEKIVAQIKKQTFSRADIFEAASSENPDFSKTNIRNLLEKMQNAGQIAKIGRNQYQKTSSKKLPVYNPSYSEKASILLDVIKEKYPLVDFRIWDLIVLNEFLNHQLSHNKIFVEVENDAVDFVFQTLAEKFPDDVLLKPTSDEVYRYSKDDGIIVTRLVSESPKGNREKHALSLEKLVVDMFASKLIQSLVSKGDYSLALNDMFSKYTIDQVKLFRYAKRRNKADEIKEFLRQKTNVKICSEETK